MQAMQEVFLRQKQIIGKHAQEMQERKELRKMQERKEESRTKDAQNTVTAMINVYVQGLLEQLGLSSFMRPSVHEVAPAKIISQNNKTWLNTPRSRRLWTGVLIIMILGVLSHLHGTIGAMM